MNIIDITKKLPFKNSNGKMDMKKMDTLVVHHDGTTRPMFYDSLKRYIGEANYHISKEWGHISYHYIIDNVGDIFKCLADDEVGYHAGNLTVNKNSIAIKFDGNMDVQKPTDKQLKAYGELIEYLTTQRPDLPKILKSSIKGHRDIKATACPGKNLYQLIQIKASPVCTHCPVHCPK